jgi:hypothetical protein
MSEAPPVPFALELCPRRDRPRHFRHRAMSETSSQPHRKSPTGVSRFRSRCARRKCASAVERIRLDGISGTNIEKTDDRSFRGSLLGLGFAELRTPTAQLKRE